MATVQGILVLQERTEEKGALCAYFRTSTRQQHYNAYCARYYPDKQRLVIYAAGNYIDIKDGAHRERIADVIIADRCFGEIVEAVRDRVQSFVPVAKVFKAAFEAFGLPIKLY